MILHATTYPLQHQFRCKIDCQGNPTNSCRIFTEAKCISSALQFEQQVNGPAFETVRSKVTEVRICMKFTILITVQRTDYRQSAVQETRKAGEEGTRRQKTQQG